MIFIYLFICLFVYLYIYLFDYFYYFNIYEKKKVLFILFYSCCSFCNGTAIEPFDFWKRRPVFGIISQYKVKLPEIPLLNNTKNNKILS